MLIAVDGPAAAGKGTLTHKLADHFNLARLDTGLIYRAVGMKLLLKLHNLYLSWIWTKGVFGMRLWVTQLLK